MIMEKREGDTYGNEQWRSEFVVVSELVLNVLNIVGKSSKLIHFHQGTSHHA